MLNVCSGQIRRGLPLLGNFAKRLLTNAQSPSLFSHCRPPGRNKTDEFLQWLYASSIIYCPTAYFTKVTLLLLIARVFAVKESVSRALHVFVFALLVAYLPIQAVKIAICTPVHSYWDPNVDGHCLDQRRIFLSDLCLAILTDLVILIVPIPLTWRLRMSWGKKLKIMLLLGAGGAATATTIYRLYAVVEFQKSTDVASDFVLLDILTVVELTIGVMCACLPATNLLLEHRFGRRPSAASPSSPRSGKYQHHGHLVWRGLGTTISRYIKSSSTETAPIGVNDEETLSMAEAPGLKAVLPNFDTELAMLSGRGDSDESRGNDEDGVITVSRCTPTCLLERIEPQSQPEQEWFALERATSRDGRREGWLSPQGASGSSGHEESRVSETITLELARVSGNRPWTRIWDGRVNGLGTTAIEEQRPGLRPLDN